ncbi:hypothetical protein FZEAL_1196 [Fusarium zealandicum]|uniref:Heterokaryon incompatibility domain-containing protein n=1 Tax=Fusarium zealandicum TaxID=1053134 RepID=A0A8H4XQ82_9HYPO|nr:hypothetical protein FZEAL_1196 [Fusarium zealandicum]
MPSLHLKEPPYPLGDTETEIRKDPKICRTCWNLYGGSASTAVPLPGIAMHENSGSINAQRAAKLGDIGEPSSWAGRGRADYASWEINVYLSEVPASAALGCVSCLLLKEALSKLTKGTLDFGDSELWLVIVFCKGNAMRVNVVRGNPPDDDFDIFGSSNEIEKETLEAYELYTLPGSPCPWPTIGSSMTIERPDWSLPAEFGGPAGHVEPDPSTKSSFNLIKSWIKTCKEGHAVCSEAESSIERALPKRVIDIGPVSNRGIHVFEHDDSMQRIDKPYIALSHCWDQWKKNIPFGDLAKTFQDAITIARKLDIRYLWIDSLCIIQDDKKDWQIEAAKMASIYNGADLVLAATGSIDGDGGCLFPREPLVTVSGSFPNGKPFEVYGRRTIRHGVFGWDTDPNASKGSSNPIAGTKMGEVQDHPLTTRAWCFQERLLATRILHYTKSELVFDCLSSMQCECGALDKHEQDPLVPARRIIKTGHKYITGTKSFRSNWSHPTVALEGEAKELAEHHELWRDLIVQYSQKQITHKTDGLPAVAGLATEWSNKLTGKYLAGLWEKDLLNHLRWLPDEEDPGEKQQYIAPSWSWLSVHRGVTWGLESFVDDEFFVRVDFTRTDCSLSGHNPFGEVKAGHIFLTGHIMPMSFSISDDNIWLEKAGHGIRKKHFERPDSLFRMRNLQGRQLLCLRFCTRQITREAYGDDSALLLVKADQEVLQKQVKEVQEFEHVYQRVGFITNYLTKAWEHRRDSKEVDMFLI